MQEPSPGEQWMADRGWQLIIDTLIPPDPGKYSWAGHLDARMQLPVVEEEIANSVTTLVFTNVRSQAEIWYQLLLEARPDWAGHIALHHGSLDKATREWVEQGLKRRIQPPFARRSATNLTAASTARGSMISGM
jgi:Lhr-like helicase